MENLNQKEAQVFQQLVEAKQQKEYMRMYSNLVERCFSDCINDFTSKSLQPKEETCLSKCAEKFLKHSERIGQRFAEENANMMGGAPSQ